MFPNGSVYSVAVLMAVATTVISLPFLKLVYLGAAGSPEDQAASITS
jgi:hypothetical protein